MRRHLLLSCTIVAAVATAGVAALPGSAGATEKIKAVTVTGTVGEKPTVTTTKKVAVGDTVVDVVETGTGAKIANGDKVTFEYLLVNGRDGAEIETTYGVEPVNIAATKGGLAPVLLDAIVGQKVGSRVLVAIPPSEGLSTNEALVAKGVKKKDTILFLMDLTASTPTPDPLKKAEGTTVAPVDGLPKVKLAKNGKPTITLPKTTAPTTLTAQVLIKGDGAVVEAGQTITVHYTGVIWKNGKQFDSSWDRGEPVDFAIGTGVVIPGWDDGLVGQTVGSQVLLVIPPESGYGTNGNSQAGIAGTDTLVFVVDILAAI